MEPEAQLIASQAMQELARQQATGQVDEVLRGQIAQQVLGGAAQQAKAREAQQQAADFQRMKQLGDAVARGQIDSRLQNFARNTDKMSRGLQAATGALSAGAGAYADYMAQQELLAKGLQAAEKKDGIAGAIKFLNDNPDYDPGEETLQRLYAGSEMGQGDALIDAAIAEIEREEAIEAIKQRNEINRAVKALEGQADDFVRMQAAKKLEQDVADDMAMAALRRADKESFLKSQFDSFVPSGVTRYDTMEDLLLGRKQLEDAATADLERRLEDLRMGGF
tara:strand:- start:2402 stop:3238 length:837 start_codon:yes stop_codon:yes gene_type:complete